MTKTMNFGLIFIMFVLSVGLVEINDVYGLSFINIDLTSSQNANDTPFGIDCDATFCYITIDKQGAIAKINISTLAVTLIDDDETVASGQDFYSVVNSNNKLFVLERDSGQMKIYDISGNSWSGIALPPDISGTNGVTYTTGYNTAPNKLTAGGNIQEFGFSSFAETVSTNSKIWQPICYEYNFNASMEGAGATDVAKWCGVVEIDPTNNSVLSRTEIVNANAIRGTHVDSVDSTVIWLSDYSADKVYKFSTASKTVTDTVTLSANSFPRGLTDDGTFLYVAKNESGDGIKTSKIIQINKSDKTITEINTGAVIGNTKEGTFEVFIASGFIVWTDGSSHIGTVSLSEKTQKTVTNTVETDGNRFGKLVNGEVWFAGKGSAKVGMFSLPSSSSSSGKNGSSCSEHPTFGTTLRCRPMSFVNNGITINGETYDVANKFHFENKIIKAETDKLYKIELKPYDSEGLSSIMWVGISFGIKEGNFNFGDGEVKTYWNQRFDGYSFVTVENNHEIINIHSFNHTGFEVCGDNNKSECPVFVLEYSFNQAPLYNMIGFEIANFDRETENRFFNDGLQVDGISLLESPVIEVLAKEKGVSKHYLRYTDPTMKDRKTAVDETGRIWMLSENIWKTEHVMPDTSCIKSPYLGYDRYCPEFKSDKKSQESLAMKSDSWTSRYANEKPFEEINDTFAYDMTGIDSRTKNIMTNPHLQLNLR